MHYREHKPVLDNRKNVLLDAYSQHPERFVNKIPTPRKLPKAVWINPPKDESSSEKNLSLEVGNV